jgi:hypothetical protein
VYPQAEVRLLVLSVSGHGYLAYLPLVLGLVGAVAAVGFVATVADSVRRRGPRPFPAWAFALLPLLGFSVQEFSERWLAGSNFPWWMVLQPTFRVGLLLQLPFGLVAYVLARLLLGAARRVATILAGGRLPSAVFSAGVALEPASLCPPRSSSLSLGWSERGPPLLLV